MKKLTLLIAAVLTVTFLSTSIFAGNYEIKKDHPKYVQIEANLLAGLQSGNLGLQASCAYMLGEMQSEKAVDALVSILRMNEDERLRLMSALSLIKIGTEKSVYLVKRTGEFSDNPRLSRMCQKFYTAHLYLKYQQENVQESLRFAGLF